MSTPTSDPRRHALLLVGCLALALAGCGGGGGGFGFGGGADAPEQVALTQDRVIVTGPDGFCIDPTATRDRDDTGFALLGNCAAIANSRRAVQPQSPAVLTAAISAPSGGGRLADSLDDLEGFFRSRDGLTLLSRTGDPSTVTVLETATWGDAFLLHASDSSAGAIAGVQPDYWRAYLDAGPRIATLSVLAPEDRALDRDAALGILRSFVGAVQAANPEDAPASAPRRVAPAQSSSPERPGQPGPLWNVGFFRRIFG
jgi:hypothetical protein